MILLHGVFHVFAGADSNGFASLSEPILCITLQDSYFVGLAAVNGNSLWPAVAAQSLANEAFGGRYLAILAEIEFNHIAIAVDRTIQEQPLAFDPEVGFIEVPFACDLTLLSIETFKQFRTEATDPAMHGRMVQINTAFRHHFFQIAQAQIASQVPSNA